jgi:hypothetical protein
MLRTSFYILVAATVVAVSPTLASARPAGATNAAPALNTRPPPAPTPPGSYSLGGGGGGSNGRGHYIATHR